MMVPAVVDDHDRHIIVIIQLIIIVFQSEIYSSLNPSRIIFVFFCPFGAPELLTSDDIGIYK